MLTIDGMKLMVDRTTVATVPLSTISKTETPTDVQEETAILLEEYEKRIAALWNMAERLGLATEDIESGNVETKLNAAPDMLEAMEEVVAITENLPVCPFCGDVKGVQSHRPDCLSHEIDAAIQKARGEG